MIRLLLRGMTIGLTLTNPMTVLSFAAVFAGLGLLEAGRDYLATTFLVFGVFAGSALWWFALSGIASLFREHLDARALRWVNRISGVVVAAFGLTALAGMT